MRLGIFIVHWLLISVNLIEITEKQAQIKNAYIVSNI